VDYFAFDGLPHLEGGIIEDQATAIAKLGELVEEMDRRYRVLKQNKVANIFDLRSKPDATEKLPFLWIIHDEFAEWMMTEDYADAVASIVGRLGVKARAAGISLVFGAQRPDANVMPMQLRANLGNRLVLRVDGEGTSEIALGERGAERLLGKGHLAARLEGEQGVVFGLRLPFYHMRSEEFWTPLDADGKVSASRETAAMAQLDPTFLVCAEDAGFRELARRTFSSSSVAAHVNLRTALLCPRRRIGCLTAGSGRSPTITEWS
jgi:DNA segregation ATPase FtsK/SpoIIIE, S-DNA-T family